MEDKESGNPNYLLGLLTVAIFWLFGFKIALASIFGYLAWHYKSEHSWAKLLFMMNWIFFGFTYSAIGLINYFAFTAIYSKEQIRKHYHGLKEFVHTLELGEELRTKMNVEDSENDEEDSTVKFVQIFLSYWRVTANYLNKGQNITDSIVNKYMQYYTKLKIGECFVFINRWIGICLRYLREKLGKLPYAGVYFDKAFQSIDSQINMLTYVPDTTEQQEDTLQSLLKDGEQIPNIFGMPEGMTPNMQFSMDPNMMRQPTVEDLQNMNKMMEEMMQLQQMMDNLNKEDGMAQILNTQQGQQGQLGPQVPRANRRRKRKF